MESSGNATPNQKELFLESLPLIARLTDWIARRDRLSPAAADQLASVVHLRLIEDDYAVFRAFEHRCSLRTFLSVVVQRIYIDARIRPRPFDGAPAQRRRQHSW